MWLCMVKCKKYFLNFVLLCVGFLAQLIQGKPVEECVKCGNYAANLIIQRSGCTYPETPDYKWSYVSDVHIYGCVQILRSILVQQQQNYTLCQVLLFFLSKGIIIHSLLQWIYTPLHIHCTCIIILQADNRIVISYYLIYVCIFSYTCYATSFVINMYMIKRLKLHSYLNFSVHTSMSCLF